MSSIHFTYNEIRSLAGSRAVLLYSGGIDSMYAALQLRQFDFEVHALVADVGQALKRDLQSNAERLGLRLHVVNVQNTICDDFIAKGILANGLFNDHFPIASSYTRPLIASEAVKLAGKVHSTLLVHSATPFQNSGARFNLSIRALAPHLNIFCPAVGEYTSREEKIAALNKAGFSFAGEQPIYSVDENLWARVIENGTLEEPWLDIPNEGIFTWTVNPEKCKEPPMELRVGFEQGLPVSLDGKRMSLLEIIKDLNVRLGRYGIGRYTGLEDGSFGVKNPEIREAPAAAMLHQSHLQMEEMVLSSEELRVKRGLDREWTNLAVFGGWYSPLKAHLEAAIHSFNRDLTGSIKWRVTSGQIFPIAKDSPHALYSARFPEFLDEFRPYSLNSFYQGKARLNRIGTPSGNNHEKANQ